MRNQIKINYLHKNNKKYMEEVETFILLTISTRSR